MSTDDRTPTSRTGTAIVGVSLDGRIIHLNAELESILGWTPDSLIGRRLTTIIPSRFRRRHEEGFRRFVETGDLTIVGEPVRLPATRADGGEEFVEFMLSMPSRSDPAAVIGSIRLLTALRAPEPFRLTNELRIAMASEDPLDVTLTDCLRLVCAELGADLGAVWIHDPWVAGLRPVVALDTVTDGDQDYVAQRNDPAFIDRSPHVRSVFERGTSLWIDDVDGAAPDPAGRTGPHRSASFIALTSDHEAVGVMELIFHDHQDMSIEDQDSSSFIGSELGRLIATRLRADIVFAERRRVQLALEARGVATWSYRFPSGQMTGDDRLAELYGLPPATASDSDNFDRYTELIDPEDGARTRADAAAAIERGERFDFRYRIRRPDGELIWLAGSGVPMLDANGEIREIAGVCYDVTDEVQAKQRLEQQARNAELSAAVGQEFVRDEPLDHKLQRTTDAMVHHLDAAFARIWTIDAGTDTLELRSSSGMYTHLDGPHSRIALGEYKIGRIGATMQPHLSNDVAHDDRISDPEWAQREGMRAFAGYPLVVGGRLLGVLAMFAHTELPASTLDALKSVSDMVAIGIEQSRAAEEIMSLSGDSRRHEATLEAALRDRAHVAEVLQASLVPRSLPEVPGFRVAARYRSGIEEVGGDFYDVLPVGHDRWAFLLGDVCGRGPEAARLTALSRHSLRLALMLDHGPGDALAALNRALLNSDNEGRFCTAVCGLMSASSDGSAHVTLAAAGHPAPLVVRSGGIVTEVETWGTLLGVIEDTNFVQSEVILHPGDSIVAFTDGILEARRDGEMFGVDRLRLVLSEAADAEADGVVDHVVRAVTKFDESASPDDLAILAIERVRVDP